MTPRVLVVDDDPGTLETFSHILRLAGFDVVTADNGFESLKLVRSRLYDVVLADLRLPDMSGIDILRTLCSMHCDTRVVLMTGLGSTEFAEEAITLGASDYVDHFQTDSQPN